MNLLKKELDFSKKLQIVEIDASEYENENKIWYNILECMFIEYENTYRIPKIRFEFSKLKSLPKKRIIKIIVPIIVVMIILCKFHAIFLNAFAALGNLFNSRIGIVAIIIRVIQILASLINTAKKFLIPLSKSVSKMLELPNFDSQLGDRESV